MAKKRFTSKNIQEVSYEIVGEEWIDVDTYVIVFNEMTDVDGDTYHLEVEYHADEERVTYTRVYDHENVEASQLVSPCFLKQIKEYILQQVGVLSEGSLLTTEEVSIDLELGISKGVTIGELRKWFSELKFEVTTPNDERIKLISHKANVQKR